MNTYTKQRWRTCCLLILAATLTGCNLPVADFKERITPLVVPSLPPPLVFVTPGQQIPPPPIEPTIDSSLTLEPVEIMPQVGSLCTTSMLYLREHPTTSATDLTLMPPGTELTSTGNEAQADGYTWFEVVTEEGTRGWAASDWLQEGSCNQIVTGGETPIIIERSFQSGFGWMDENSTNHYGIDIHSLTGKATILTPFSDQVIDSDSCAACLETDPDDGNTYGNIDLDYNYGYGAMIIMEYTYSDLSEEERSNLALDGIDLHAGQSMYLMIAHLNPNQDISDPETILSQGDTLANIGNSGNSDGAHAHVEVAINSSGLTPADDQAIVKFWLNTVAERVYNDPEESRRRGNRIDPSPLFDL